MKKTILFSLMMLIFGVSTSIAAGIISFSVQGQYLNSAGSIPKTSGQAKTFTADFAIGTTQGSTYNTIVISLVHTLNSTETVLSTFTMYSGDWPNTNFYSSTISGTLAASVSSGTVSLKSRVYEGSTAGAISSANMVYNVIVTGGTEPAEPGEPVIGVAPPYTSPVTGAVPLYEYVTPNGFARILGKQYYSYLPGYSVKRIFGYLFATQQPNTVPIYAFMKNSARFYGLSSVVPSGYTYQGILGYVYLTQVSKSMPVYQHSNSSGYLFENTLGFINGYTFDDSKFYILQNPQVSLNPLPDFETEEFYQHFNSAYVDHYYASVKLTSGAWVYEKVLAYISRIQKPNMIPLYRYFNPTTTDHYYPTAKQNYGDYIYEGIAGYVYATSQPGTIPIYSYWNGQFKNHYYDPRNGATGPQYQNEGIKFYMQQYPY